MMKKREFSTFFSFILFFLIFNNVSFGNHQFDRLEELRGLGRPLCLLIGRGSMEETLGKRPALNLGFLGLRSDTVVIFGDKQSSVMDPRNINPQFVLDFKKMENLKRFHSNTFDMIIFDVDTWRFFGEVSTILEYKRMLKTGGRLIFGKPGSYTFSENVENFSLVSYNNLNSLEVPLRIISEIIIEYGTFLAREKIREKAMDFYFMTAALRLETCFNSVSIMKSNFYPTLFFRDYQSVDEQSVRYIEAIK